MPRAAVITPYFVDRDAVCNDVRGSAEALGRLGFDARVFAVGGHSERLRFHPAAEAAAFAREPADLLYFHFSTGKPELLEGVRATRARRLLKFHNITPPEHFSIWSDELAEASRRGRSEMPEVGAVAWGHVLGDSAYNLADLAPHLAADVPRSVVPPFHETDALLRHAADGGGRSNRILSVGRLAPSKGHPFLLRVMRHLVHDLRVEAALDIVGKPDPRLAGYVRVLAMMVREYGLESHVTFHAEVADAELARLYGGAAAFATTSEHEGFCVPVIEAMAFGVPVVALAATALPETVGDAGLLWEARDPRPFAASLARLLREPEAHALLARAGRERYAARFTNAAIESRLAAVVEGDVTAGSAAGTPRPRGTG